LIIGGYGTNLLAPAMPVAMQRKKDWVSDKDPEERFCVFEFSVGGIPGLGYVRAIGWDELSVHAALWPTAEALPSSSLFFCRAARKPIVARLAVIPRGYKDHGHFIF